MSIAIWLILLASPFETHADEPVTGIFLTVECRKDVPKRREMLTGKAICVTQSPIIYPKEFETIGKVTDIGLNVYFEVKFTKPGYETLLKLTKGMPDARMALVVNDEVFALFKSSDVLQGRTCRFQTFVKNKEIMEDVQRQLVSAMAAAAG